MECQRGVIGDMAGFPALRAAVQATGIVPVIAEVCTAARAANRPVVHAVAEVRPGRRGTPANAPLLVAAAAAPTQLEVGSPAAAVVGGIIEPAVDLRSARRHGVSPFHGTDLDPLLRSLDVDTVVLVGVSLNVGIVGTAIEAVNRGFRVVVVTDAVCAVPAELGETLLSASVAQLATLSTAAEIAAAFRGAD